MCYLGSGSVGCCSGEFASRLSKLASGPGFDADPKRATHSATEWRCHLAHGEPAVGSPCEVQGFPESLNPVL
jgi:hypothetical protein